MGKPTSHSSLCVHYVHFGSYIYIYMYIYMYIYFESHHVRISLWIQHRVPQLENASRYLNTLLSIGDCQGLSSSHPKTNSLQNDQDSTADLGLYLLLWEYPL